MIHTFDLTLSVKTDFGTLGCLVNPRRPLSTLERIAACNLQTHISWIGGAEPGIGIEPVSTQYLQVVSDTDEPRIGIFLQSVEDLCDLALGLDELVTGIILALDTFTQNRLNEFHLTFDDLHYPLINRVGCY